MGAVVGYKRYGMSTTIRPWILSISHLRKRLTILGTRRSDAKPEQAIADSEEDRDDELEQMMCFPIAD